MSGTIMTEALAARDSARDAFERAVIAGLSQSQKSLPTAYLYDARGSELFEEITELDEYYLTRTETMILENCASDWGARLPQSTVLVEFGSGSSRKTEILLEASPRITHYAPIDVSQSALDGAVERLSNKFPRLDVVPILGQFQAANLPPDIAMRRRAGFFPGSTIGNFSTEAAIKLLRSFASLLGPKGSLLIGVDLRKDPNRLVRAYDDQRGVTAEFNRNLLRRINRELDGQFDLDAFEHVAIYNTKLGRIEMHLVSRRSQIIRVAGQRFTFAEGERVHTENSYKYTLQGFRELAEAAGWRSQNTWTDGDNLFSVHELITD